MSGRGSLSIRLPDDTSEPPKPSAREIIALRKEAKLKAEEEELTFKPQLIPKRGGHKEVAGTGGDVSRFDRLYSDALKRHMEDKYKEAVIDKELTFKPKLTSLSRSSSRERSAPSPARVERLHKSATGNVKAPVTEEKPSFKPTISKRAKSIERGRGETSANLYAHSKIAKELHSAMKAENEEIMASACTFKPQTNTKSRPPSRGRGMGLTERMEKFEALKQAKLEAAKRAQLDKQKESATFTPTVTRRANSRSSTPTGRVPVYARLSSTPAKTESPEERSKKYESELTFKPQLFSKRAPSPNRKADEAGSVHERLYTKGQERKKQSEIERELIQQEIESELTFKPVINTDFKKRGVSDDDPENSPVFERLIVKGSTKQIMQNVLAKLKEELELKDCTFKPTLTAADPRRNGRNNVQGLDPASDSFLGRMAAEKDKLRCEMEMLEGKKKEDEMEGVTFKPTINPMSAAIVALKRGDEPKTPEAVFDRLKNTTTESASIRNSVDGPLSGVGCGTSVASSVYSNRGYLAQEPRKGPRLSEAEREKVAERLTHRKTKSFENFLNKTSEKDTPLTEDAVAPRLVVSAADAEVIASRLAERQTAAYRAHHEEEPGGGVDVQVSTKVVPQSELVQISEKLHMKRTTSWALKTAPAEEPKDSPIPERDANGRLVIPDADDKLVSLSTPRAKSPKSSRDASVFDDQPRELVFPGSPSANSSAPVSPSSSPAKRLSRVTNGSGISTQNKPISTVFDFSEVEEALKDTTESTTPAVEETAAVPATEVTVEPAAELVDQPTVEPIGEEAMVHAVVGEPMAYAEVADIESMISGVTADMDAIVAPEPTAAKKKKKKKKKPSA